MTHLQYNFLVLRSQFKHRHLQINPVHALVFVVAKTTCRMCNWLCVVVIPQGLYTHQLNAFGGENKTQTRYGTSPKPVQRWPEHGTYLRWCSIRTYCFCFQPHTWCLESWHPRTISGHQALHRAKGGHCVRTDGCCTQQACGHRSSDDTFWCAQRPRSAVFLPE